MKFTTSMLAAAVGVFAVSAVATGGDLAPRPTRNVVETAREAGSFSTLVAALRAAGLVETLTGPGPFTVFAPTDEAFAHLPDGELEALLRPENAGRLRQVLTHHIVAGRVSAADLLPATTARTVSGDEVALGLRVGDANVIKTDIQCSNGVIHVIDAVLVPPFRAGASAPGHVPAPLDVAQVVTDAIDRGVPVFNSGDVAECARIYRDTARRLVQSAHLAELHRLDLAEALTKPTDDATEEAWTLRRAFDGVLADISFVPRSEAALPQGFPGAGPVGRVVRKEYPRYRAARAQGGEAFWKLLEHIRKNDVEMTAPVEMTMDDEMRTRDMAFLYEEAAQGQAGTQGAVAVLDLEPLTVLSIGVRGRRNDVLLARARKVLEARLAADGIRAAGPWRTLGYNSPMVPAEQQYWELQVPID